MMRPVRPVALYVLTLCALYPGLTSVFQGLYAFVCHQEFALLGQQGVFVDTLVKFGAPIWLPNLMKAAIGGAFLAGVPVSGRVTGARCRSCCSARSVRCCSAPARA
jgi:hypothetical protein